MSKDPMDSSWMDESEPGVQDCLTCHVEIEIQSGKTYRDILAKAALALRTAAVQVEAGKLDTGHHPIKTLTGEEIGTIYLDYHGHEEL